MNSSSSLVSSAFSSNSIRGFFFGLLGAFGFDRAVLDTFDATFTAGLAVTLFCSGNFSESDQYKEETDLLNWNVVVRLDFRARNVVKIEVLL
jgi:hypothetical protein